MPRTRPSVESIAMQRAVFSPRCCETSTTRLSWRGVDAGVRDRERGVDVGQRAGRELDVDDGADDLGDPAVLTTFVAVAMSSLSSESYLSASAPLTISISSFVT